MPRTMDREARKAQLAEAVWEVILEQGIGAVSVRTVADRAGLVVGSLRHVFPTRAELIRFSAELMVRRASERIRAVPERDDPREYALEVLAHLLPVDPDSRAELEVNLALLGEHAAVPELVEVREEAHRGLAELMAGLVALLAAGADVESSAAPRLHALVDGLAVHLLHRSGGADPEAALAILREEIWRIAAQGSPGV